MPTIEEWRRWMSGEDVEGFPEHTTEEEPEEEPEDYRDVRSEKQDEEQAPKKHVDWPSPLIRYIPEETVVLPGGLGEGARIGDVYYDESDGGMKVWTGSDWAALAIEDGESKDTFDHEKIAEAASKYIPREAPPEFQAVAKEIEKQIDRKHVKVSVEFAPAVEEYHFHVVDFELDVRTSTALSRRLLESVVDLESAVKEFIEKLARDFTMTRRRKLDELAKKAKREVAADRALRSSSPPSEEAYTLYPKAAPGALCERCGRKGKDVERAPCMTAYEWDGKGKDPNQPPILCKECREEWIEHWDDMWKEYYSGRL